MWCLLFLCVNTTLRLLNLYIEYMNFGMTWPLILYINIYEKERPREHVQKTHWLDFIASTKVIQFSKESIFGEALQYVS